MSYAVELTCLVLFAGAAVAMLRVILVRQTWRLAPLAVLLLVLAGVSGLQALTPGQAVPATGLLLAAILGALGAWQLNLLCHEQHAHVEELDREQRGRSGELDRSVLWMESLPLACIVSGADGVITDWNPAARRIFGHRPEEAVGRTLEDLIVPDDERVSFERLLGRLAVGGPLERTTHVNRKLDGRRIVCEWTHAPMRDAQGKFLGLLSMAEDVTAEREADEAARLSSQRFEAAASMVSDAIWDWNLQTGRIWWGPGIEASFGYAVEGAETDLAWWSARLHPDDLERVDEGLQHAIDSPDVHAWRDTYRFRRQDGSWAEVLDRARLFRDETGRGLRMIGAMVDLSRRPLGEGPKAAFLRR